MATSLGTVTQMEANYMLTLLLTARRGLPKAGTSFAETFHSFLRGYVYVEYIFELAKVMKCLPNVMFNRPCMGLADY